MKLARRTIVGTAIATISMPGVSWLTAGQAFAQDAASPALEAASPLGDKWLGSKDAPVTMIEYASATCPHCAQFHENTFPTLKTEYIDTGKVGFVMREFPFDDLSLAAFMVARCAPGDKYFPVIDVLFERQKRWTGRNPKGELFKIARQAGMTEKDFEACLTNRSISDGIVETRNRARSVLGVNATPTFFINGMKVSGNQPVSHFRSIIDERLS